MDPLASGKLTEQTDLFQRVFSQMTPAECVRVLRWAGLLNPGAHANPVPHYLTAESTLSYLHWNNGEGTFYQTSPDYRYTGGIFTQNRTAADIREILQGLFERSPSSFLAQVPDETRRQQLTLLPSSSANSHPAKTLIVCWNRDQLTAALNAGVLTNRDNLTIAEHAFAPDPGQQGNITRLARQLADHPPGQRVIKMGTSQSLWKIHEKDRLCFFDREFDSPRRHGLSVERWYQEIRARNSSWRKFWEGLRVKGEAILGQGQGTGLCDRLLIDAENYRQFWKFRPEWIREGIGYEGGETLDDIFRDPDWPSWRKRIAAGSPLPQEVWATWKGWNINTDERVFLFDACMRSYLASRFHGLGRVAKEYFPHMLVFEYATCLSSPGTHPGGRATEAEIKPYGVGGTTGGVSIECYGEFEGARWYWPKHAEQRWNGTSGSYGFAALVNQISRMGSVMNGSIDPRSVYLSYNELPSVGKLLGREGYWAELILHGALLFGDGRNLPRGGIHFYQSGSEASPEAHQKFCDLIDERDAVVRFSDAQVVPPAPIRSFDQGLLVSSVVAGGRQVFRITPNHSIETKVTHSKSGIEFANRLATLKIPGGQLDQRSQSKLAPLGWWVICPSQS